MPRRGADLVVETLAAAGVRHLFALSGNQILSLFDATLGRGLSIIHTRHEAAAAHMADAWGRLTDRPGVALVTAGPGHCNAISALYGALMAESPMVLLSGASPLAQRGRGAFQEMDQAAAAAPVTKAAWMAADAERLGEDIARALALAVEGRPGPVHVSLPGDLLDATVVAPPTVVPAAAPAGVDEAAVADVLALLADAKRPLVLTGPALGRGERRETLRTFSRITGVPVLPIESPRGVNDPWLRGATACLANADVVVLLGKPLDFALGFGRPPVFAPDARFVSIDAGAVRAGAEALAVDLDPTRAAAALASAARRRPWPQGFGWADDVARRRGAVPSAWEEARRSSRAPMHPLRVCAALAPFVDAGAVLVSDGGEFGQWVQAALEGRERLINGLSGSIGSAIPMALAAKLAHPDRTVFATLGDGTFGFHAFELDTAVRYALPIVVVIGNDARWNAEHTLQLRHYGAARAVGCELLPTRYDRVVEALGGHGEHVERPEQLAGAIERAVASGRPACVNVMIEPVPAPVFRSSGLLPSGVPLIEGEPSQGSPFPSGQGSPFPSRGH